MGSERILTLIMFIGYILKIIFIIVPILIILLGTIDLIKYMLNPNDNKTNIKMFVRRLIMGVSIFFVTTLVYFAFNLINQNINNQYLKCLEDPSMCKNILDNLKKDINNCKNINNKNECCKFILNNKNATYNKDINNCSIPISTLIEK